MEKEFQDLDKGAIRLLSSVKNCPEVFLKMEQGKMAFAKREPFLKLDTYRQLSIKARKRKVYERFCMGFAEPFHFRNGYALFDAFSQGLLKRENYPVLTELMEGKPVTIQKNALYFRSTPEGYFPSDEESLKTVFSALVDRWLDHSTFLYPDRDRHPDDKPFLKIKILQESLQTKVSPSRGTDVKGLKDYAFIFDTQVQLDMKIDQKWRPELYATSKFLYDVNKLKLVWDLMHYGDRLNLVKVPTGCYVVLAMDVHRMMEESLAIQLDRRCPGDVFSSEDFHFRTKLMAEISGDMHLMESVKYLEQFYAASYRIGMVVEAAQEPSAAVNDLEKAVEQMQKITDGLRALRTIMNRFAQKTKQSKMKPLKVGGPAAKILLDRIELDPLAYTDDSRQCVADIARKLVAG